ncbi:MAG: amidohydrolase family protein [Candidatus Bathyarchaeia archaeon]
MSDRGNPNLGRLREAVETVMIMDTHEHLPQEEDRIKEPVDVLSTFLPHYASSDLVSAGMAEEELEEIRNPRIPLRMRWEKFAPYWERIQNTGYARALEIALRDLYGIEGLSLETYEEASRRMREANKKGLYRWILKEKSRIDLSILDSERIDVDREFFAPVMRFDGFIALKEKWDLENLERRCKSPIHSLDELEKALELEFLRLKDSIVGVKIALAYRRSLFFEKSTHDEAEKVFNRLYAQKVFRRIDAYGGRITKPEGLSFEEAKPLQDYMMHKVVALAAKHGLPIQIHTGLQEGNENLITNSNPVHMTNLFMEYKEAKFDLFHGSYPYIGELSVLAKNFPNVFVDMCWLHIISPTVARRALSEWLETVPGNKILAFGGDYRFVEGVYAHAKLARENVARVLQEKIEDGTFTEAQATRLAVRLLRENALDLFFQRAGIGKG